MRTTVQSVLQCLAVLTLLPAIGCSEHYPIAPTVCDEWCNVQPSACEFPHQPFEAHDRQTPADCVSNCEIDSRVWGKPCEPLFVTYMECVKLTEAAGTCFGGSTEAGSESQSLPDAGLAGTADCNAEWRQVGDCSACLESNCTLCKDYCEMREAHHCNDFTGRSCIIDCMASTPGSLCLPAFETSLECKKQNLTANGCATIYDPNTGRDSCDTELNQCLNF